MDLGKLKLSVEDKFVILQLNVEDDILPQGRTLEHFAEILASLDKQYEVICDFRDVKRITNDLEEFIDEFEFFNSKLLVNKEQVDFFKRSIHSEIEILPVDKNVTNFHGSEVDLDLFADLNYTSPFYTEYLNKMEQISTELKGEPTKAEYELFLRFAETHINKPYFKEYEDYTKFCSIFTADSEIASDLIFPRRYLNRLFGEIGKNSLLSELCIIPNTCHDFNISSFQAHSINHVNNDNQNNLIKPYIKSYRTNILFQKALNEFKHLMNKRDAKEIEFQTFFEKRPEFLHVLGYKKIHAKIILERDDGTALEPDFMLEPISEDWWDILDIKIPSKSTIVSSQDNRIRFAASVTELHAQLREYAAYFENEKYAKRVQEKYGVKCYRPKMIGVIGNDVQHNDERQLRRLMTSYTDLNVMSFDQLYRIAQKRLLI